MTLKRVILCFVLIAFQTPFFFLKKKSEMVVRNSTFQKLNEMGMGLALKIMNLSFYYYTLISYNLFDQN